MPQVRSRYRTDGYVLIQAISPRVAETLIEEAQRLQGLVTSLEHSVGDYNLEAPDGGYGGQHAAVPSYRGILRKISNAADHSIPVRRVSEAPEIVDLSRELLETSAVKLVHSVLWYKPPRVGSAKPPHQDAPYLTGSPNHYVTFWIALDSCNPDNGCLEVVTGSHAAGLIDHDGAEAQIPQHVWAQQRPTPVSLSPGEGIAFHPYLLHASAPNVSDEPRRALMLRYHRSERP